MKKENLRSVWIKVKDIKIHPVAQRLLKQPYVQHLVDHLDLQAIGALHAVEYRIGGTLRIWVVDGQHRWAALMAAGYQEMLIMVLVHDDVKDDAGSCALFLKLNKRSNIGPFETFDKEVKSGVAEAVGALKIVESHGLKMTRTGHDGGICCVMALKKIYKRDQGKTLDQALGVAISAWGRTHSGMEGSLMDGLAYVCWAIRTQVAVAVLPIELDAHNSGRKAGRLARL
jgi:hypothetical protein